MAISNIWTINDLTFSSRGFTNLSLRYRSQDADVARWLDVDSDYDSGVPSDLDYGDEVTIKRNGTTVFVGRMMEPRRMGGPSSERIEYMAVGPWWDLTQIIYEQDYERLESSSVGTVALPRLVLGTNASGTRINSGAVISDVLTFADNVGVSIAEGDLDVTTQFPFEEMNNLTCADVIKRVLRWNPDVVTYIDYTTATPTLHAKKRSNLTSKTWAISDVVIQDNVIRPRNDLKKDGVVVKYEKIGDDGGTETREVVTDTAGTTTNALTTLKLYFTLQGARTTYLSQSVTTATIQSSSATWWKKRHTSLKNATAISVANDSQTAVDDSDAVNDGTSYSRELVEGQITEWMAVGTNDQYIEADVTYTPPGGTPITERLDLTVTGTSAATGLYEDVGSFDAAEPTPSGLAGALLASLDTLHYEGSLRLAEEEALTVNWMGYKANISGAATAWASMNAMIYEVAYQIDSGRTDVAFGPPGYLGANDLFQLLRQARTREPQLGEVRLSIGSIGTSSSLGTRFPKADSSKRVRAADGFLIVYIDETTAFLPWATVLADYDSSTDTDWSIDFVVSSNAFTKVVSYTTGTDLWDDVGSSQTVYRLPVIRDNKLVTTGGTFRADAFTDSGELVQSMIKIG